MSTSSPTNPYESPREATLPSAHSRNIESGDIEGLKRRVTALERRLGRSWVAHDNLFLRALGVFGYWLIGYALVAVITFPVIAVVVGLVWLVTGRFLLE